MSVNENQNISSSPEPGWYPDPSSPRETGNARYWDGYNWTDQVKKPVPPPPPPTPPLMPNSYPPPMQQQPTPYQQNMYPNQPYTGTHNKLIMSPFGEYYSGWWRRVAATLIDSLILFTVFFAFLFFAFVGLILSLPEYEVNLLLEGVVATTEMERAITLIVIIGLLFSAAFAFLYQVIQLGVWGKTIGDRALGIRVASENTGEICSWGAATKRTLILTGFSLGGLIPMVGVLFSLAGIVNYFSMLWDSQRRCWHDLVGGTVVLKTRP